MSKQVDVDCKLIEHETQNEEIAHNFILTFTRTDRSELVTLKEREYLFFASSLELVS
jgi:hypothetical protein